MTITILQHSVMIEAKEGDRHFIKQLARTCGCEPRPTTIEGAFRVRFNSYEDIYKFIYKLTENYMAINIE